MPKIRVKIDPYASVSRSYTRHELGKLLLDGPNGIVGISTMPGSVQYAVTLTERTGGELLVSSPEVVYGRGGRILPRPAREMLP